MSIKKTAQKTASNKLRKNSGLDLGEGIQSALNAHVAGLNSNAVNQALKSSARKTASFKKRKIGEDEENLQNASGAEQSFAVAGQATAENAAAESSGQPMQLAQADGATQSDVSSGLNGGDAAEASQTAAVDASAGLPTSQMIGLGALGAFGVGGTAVAVSNSSNSSNSSSSGASSVADTTPPVYQSMAVHSNGGVAGAGTIVLTYDSTLDATNLPVAGDFAITINGAANPVSALAVSGNTITLTLANALTAGALTIGFNYTDAAGNNANAIQDAAGNDAASLGITTGIVADGYIRGAQMYLDTPTGLQILTGVVTDENGNFFIPNGLNPNGYALVAIGGINVDTGLPNTAILKSPVQLDSQGNLLPLTINPLTTLVSAVMDATGVSGTVAATQVADSLGLALANGTTLLSYNPLADSSATGVAVQQAAAQVATIVALAIDGSGSSTTGDTVMSNLATAITNASTASTTISLSDSTVLSQALTNVVVSTTVQSTIADATVAIGSATTITQISNAQSQFIDSIAPDAPTALTVAAFTNDTTPTVRVSFNATSLDGEAAVAGDKIILMANGVEVATVTLVAADIRLGYVDLTSSILAEGSQSFTARLVDQSGNAGSASTAVLSQIDVQGATVAISADGGLLNMVFSEAVSGFSVSDISVPTGVSLGSLTGPITLSDGTVKYSVAYTAVSGSTVGNISIAANSYQDMTGNNGAASNTLSMANIVAPVVTIKSIGGHDSTVSAQTGDNVVRGMGVPGLDVTIKSGSTILGTATADSNGVWSYTLTTTNMSTLGQGADSITAEQTKSTGSGTVTGASADFNLSVDTGGPGVTLNTIAGNNAINAPEKSAGVAITGTAEAGAKVALTLASSVVKQLTADNNGNWSYSLNSADYKVIGTGTNVSAVATDAAGNSSAVVSQTVTVDTKAPSLGQFSLTTSSNTGLAALGMTNQTTPTINFTAEAGSTVAVYVGITQVGTATAVSPGNYTYVFTGSQLAQGLNAIKLIASDGEGNTTTRTGTIKVDSTAPTLTISDNHGSGTINIADGPVLYTFTFSKPVTGFSASDVNVTHGIKGVFTAVSSTVYTLAVLPQPGYEGNVVVDVATGAARDASGNASVLASNGHAVDMLSPTASISLSDTALKAGETSVVTITFSEAVTGLTNADLTLVNGTLTDLVSGNGGLTWTATYTPTVNIEDTTNVVMLANTGVVDLAANPGAGVTTSANYTIDTLRPTATIVMADTALNAGETSLVTITFSEAVTGLTNSDLTLVNGTLTNLVSGNGGLIWTATYTPTVNIEDTTNVITLDNTGIADLAGNAGVGTTTSANYVVDTLRPTVSSIVLADTALKVGDSSLVTIIFSEAVSGFTTADLTIDNGTLSNLTSSDGITWTATYTPTANVEDTTNVITLANSGVADQSGNAGVGTSTSANYVVDTKVPNAPTLALASDTGSSNSDGKTSNGQVNVSGIESGATWEYSTNGGTNWTAGSGSSITLTGDGAKPIVVRQIDAAGNVGTASSTLGFTLDTTAPTAPTLALASDTGSSSSDGKTRNGQVNVSGIESGATWQYSTDNGANWSASQAATTTSVTLSGDGAKTLIVRQTDAAGNVGTASSALDFTLDTTAPTAPTLALASDTGSSSSDGKTSNGQVNVSGIESGATWQYSTDNGANWSASQAATTTSLTLTGDGAKSLIVRQTDAAGNVGMASSALAFTLDTTAPTGPTLALASDTGSSSSDGKTSNGQVNVSGIESGATWQYSTDNGANWSASQAATTTSVTLTGDGAKSLIVRQTDAAGNVGTVSSALAFTLDTTAPTFSSGSTATAVNENIAAGTTVYTALTSDANSVAYSLSGTDASAFSINSSGVVSVNASPNYEAQSSYSFNVVATDLAGNATAKAVSLAINNINEAPTTTGSLTTATAVTSRPFNLDLSTYFADADGISAPNNWGMLTYAITGTLPTGLSLDTSTGVISGTASAIASASNVTVTATDGGGLTASRTFSISAVNAPVIQSFTVADAAGSSTIGKAGDTLTFSVTMSEDVAVTGGTPSITFSVGGQSIAASYVSGSGSNVLVFQGNAPAANGTTVTVSAISLNGATVVGQSSTEPWVTTAVGTSYTGYTLDSYAPSAPTLALGTGVSGGATSAEATAGTGVVTVSGELGASIAVTFTNGSATVTKTVTGRGSAQAVVLTSGDITTLGNGAISVSAIATDAAGNASGAGTTSFTLDMAAPSAPTLALGTGVSGGVTSAEATAGSGVVTVSGEAGASIAVTFTNGSATVTKTVTGTGSAQSVVLTAGDLTTLGNGSISVSAIATDAAGNASGAGTTSFSLDTVAPTAPTLALVTGVSDGATSAEATAGTGVVTVSGETGASIAVTFTNGSATVTKNVTGTGAAQAVVLASADLTTLGNGAISVSAIATDPAGNASSAGTTSFSLDTVAPTAPTLALGSGVSGGATSSEATAGTGVVTVSGEAGASIAVTFTNGSASVTKTVTGTGSAQAVVLASNDLTTLGNGSISVSAVATDAAGNASGTGTTSFTLDMAAPSAPTLALGTGVSGGATSAEATAGSGVVTVSGEAGASIAVTFTNGSATVTKTVSGTGSAQAVVLTSADLTALGNSSISVSAVATDSAGNASGAGTTSFTLDTVAPTAPTLALGTGISGGANSAEATASTGVVTVLGENGASIAVTFTNGNASVTKNVTGTGSAQAVVLASSDLTTLGNGSVSVSAIATDAAGNASGAGTTSFTFDTTAPSFSSGAIATAINENSGAGQVIYTAATTDANTIAYSLKSTGDYGLLGINASTGAVTLTDNPNYEDKSSYSFTVVATDLAGNVTEKAVTLAINNINDVPTGTVTISGSTIQGSVLTAANTLADQDGLGTVAYQWKANNVAISGATGSTYTLTQSEVGKTITVNASYTDGRGTTEAVTSSATTTIANDPQSLLAATYGFVRTTDTITPLEALSSLYAGVTSVSISNQWVHYLSANGTDPNATTLLNTDSGSLLGLSSYGSSRVAAITGTLLKTSLQQDPTQGGMARLAFNLLSWLSGEERSVGQASQLHVFSLDGDIYNVFNAANPNQSVFWEYLFDGTTYPVQTVSASQDLTSSNFTSGSYAVTQRYADALLPNGSWSRDYSVVVLNGQAQDAEVQLIKQWMTQTGGSVLVDCKEDSAVSSAVSSLLNDVGLNVRSDETSIASKTFTPTAVDPTEVNFVKQELVGSATQGGSAENPLLTQTDLTLPTEILGGSVIWTSSNPGVIDAEGHIITTGSVVLHAHVTFANGSNRNYDFNYKVYAPPVAGTGLALRIVDSTAFLANGVHPDWSNIGAYLNKDLLAQAPIYVGTVGDVNWSNSPATNPVRGADSLWVYTGSLIAPVTGSYIIKLHADDSARVYLGDKGNLSTVSATWRGDNTITVSLVAGQNYPLNIFFKPNPGDTSGNYISLSWQPPGASSFVTVPSSALALPPEGMFTSLVGFPSDYLPFGVTLSTAHDYVIDQAQFDTTNVAPIAQNQEFNFASKNLYFSPENLQLTDTLAAQAKTLSITLDAGSGSNKTISLVNYLLGSVATGADLASKVQAALNAANGNDTANSISVTYDATTKHLVLTDSDGRTISNFVLGKTAALTPTLLSGALTQVTAGTEGVTPITSVYKVAFSSSDMLNATRLTLTQHSALTNTDITVTDVAHDAVGLGDMSSYASYTQAALRKLGLSTVSVTWDASGYLVFTDTSGKSFTEIKLNSTSTYDPLIALTGDVSQGAVASGSSAVVTSSATLGDISGKVQATDANGDALTYNIIEGAKFGSATLDPATGKWTYTPAAGGNFKGWDQFTVTVTDSHGMVSEPMAVTISNTGAPQVSMPVVKVITATDSNYVQPVAKKLAVPGDMQLSDVFIAQTHVNRTSDPFVMLNADRSALVKVNVTSATGAPAPDMYATVTDSHGNVLGSLLLTGPANLPTSVDLPSVSSFGNQTNADSYVATLPGSWIQPGITVTISAGDNHSTLQSFTPNVGADVTLTVRNMNLSLFDGSSNGYAVGPNGWAEEAFARLPVQTLKMYEYPSITFDNFGLQIGSNWATYTGNMSGSVGTDTFLGGGSFQGVVAFGIKLAGSLELANFFGSGRGSTMSYVGFSPGVGGGLGGGSIGGGDANADLIWHEFAGHGSGLAHTASDPNDPYSNLRIAGASTNGWFYIPDPDPTYTVAATPGGLGPNWGYDQLTGTYLPNYHIVNGVKYLSQDTEWGPSGVMPGTSLQIWNDYQIMKQYAYFAGQTQWISDPSQNSVDGGFAGDGYFKSWSDPIKLTISGSLMSGQTLTATLTDRNPTGSVSYQWYANGEAISGATATTYVLTNANIGKAITVKATYSSNSSKWVTSSASVPVVATDAHLGSISISGTVQTGTALSANLSSAGTGLTGVAYRWTIADNANGSGGTTLVTSSNYTPDILAAGKYVSVSATYTDSYGTHTVSSNFTKVASNNTKYSVVIIGDAVVGEALVAELIGIYQIPTGGTFKTVSHGNEQANYQWYADGVAIANATGATYRLTQSELGKAISVRLAFSDLLTTPSTPAASVVVSSATSTVATPEWVIINSSNYKSYYGDPVADMPHQADQHVYWLTMNIVDTNGNTAAPGSTYFPNLQVNAIRTIGDLNEPFRDILTGTGRSGDSNTLGGDYVMRVTYATATGLITDNLIIPSNYGLQYAGFNVADKGELVRVDIVEALNADVSAYLNNKVVATYVNSNALANTVFKGDPYFFAQDQSLVLPKYWNGNAVTWSSNVSGLVNLSTGVIDQSKLAAGSAIRAQWVENGQLHTETFVLKLPDTVCTMHQLFGGASNVAHPTAPLIVTSDLTLPTQLDGGNVSWSSSATSVIDNAGHIVSNGSAILTATVTWSNGAVQTFSEHYDAVKLTASDMNGMQLRIYDTRSLNLPIGDSTGATATTLDQYLISSVLNSTALYAGTGALPDITIKSDGSLVGSGAAQEFSIDGVKYSTLNTSTSDPATAVSGGKPIDALWEFSGYYVAPTAGTYTFAFSADQVGRFYLQNGAQINKLDSWIWNSNNKTMTVSLTQGQVVPMWVFLKDSAPGYWGDWVSLKVQIPGATSFASIPASSLAPMTDPAALPFAIGALSGSTYTITSTQVASSTDFFSLSATPLTTSLTQAWNITTHTDDLVVVSGSNFDETILVPTEFAASNMQHWVKLVLQNANGTTTVQDPLESWTITTQTAAGITTMRVQGSVDSTPNLKVVGIQVTTDDNLLDADAGVVTFNVNRGPSGLIVTDMLRGNYNVASGTLGNDMLDQSSATTMQLITGGDGNDSMKGGAANDVLDGGSGNDVLYGGAGNDRFLLSTGTDQVHGGESAGATSGEVNSVVVAVSDLTRTTIASNSNGVLLSVHDDDTDLTITTSAGSYGINGQWRGQSAATTADGIQAVLITDGTRSDAIALGSSGNDALDGAIFSNSTLSPTDKIYLYGLGGNDSAILGLKSIVFDGGVVADTASLSWAGVLPSTTGKTISIVQYPGSSSYHLIATDGSGNVTTLLDINQNTSGVNDYTAVMYWADSAGNTGAVAHQLLNVETLTLQDLPGYSFGLSSTGVNQVTSPSTNDSIRILSIGTNTLVDGGAGTDALAIDWGLQLPTQINSASYDTITQTSDGVSLSWKGNQLLQLSQTTAGLNEYSLSLTNVNGSTVTNTLLNEELLSLTQLQGTQFGFSDTGVATITASASQDTIILGNIKSVQVDAGAGVDTVSMVWSAGATPNLGAGSLSLTQNTDADATKNDWHLSADAVKLIDVTQTTAGQNSYSVTVWNADGSSITDQISNAEYIKLAQLNAIKSSLSGNAMLFADADLVLRLKNNVYVATIDSSMTTNSGVVGSISSGGVTRDNTLGLSGQADAGSTVQIYDGATLLGTATVTDSAWSYTTPTLAEGAHSFTAKITDSPGNFATTSSVAVTVRSYINVGSTMLLSHSSASGSSTTTSTLTSASLVGSSGIAVLTANDVTQYGNAASPFVDSATSATDLLISDVTTGELKLVTHSGVAGNNTSAGVSVTYNGASANGNVIVFTNTTDARAFGNNGVAFAEYSNYKVTNQTEVPDLFAYNHSTGNLTLLSHNTNNQQAVTSSPVYRGVTADGQYVVYSAGSIGSYGNNGTAFSGGGSGQLLVARVSDGELRMISHSATNATQGLSATFDSISADSNYVIFRANDATQLGNSGVAFTDSATGTTDYFAYRLSDGNIRLLTHAAGDNLASSGASVVNVGQNSDGTYLFVTTADSTKFGFVDADTTKTDLIAINLADGSYKLVSHTPAVGNTSAGATASTFVKSIGNYVYFTTTDSTVLGAASDGDTAKTDLWRYDMTSGSTTLISHANDTLGAAMNGSFIANSLVATADQRYVAFSMDMPSGTHDGLTIEVGGAHVFVADTQTGIVALVNHNSNNFTKTGYQAWGGATALGFTADCNTLVYDTSFLGYLGGYSASGYYDRALMAYDIVSGNSRLLSHSANSSNTVQGEPETFAGVSADGQWALFTANDATKFGNAGVAFADSDASAADLFATNIATGEIRLLSGTAGVSIGSAVTFSGLSSDGNTAYFTAANVGTLKTSAGTTLTDSATSGLDLLGVRLNQLDLTDATDTVAISGNGAGTKYDNITASHTLGLDALLAPDASFTLMELVNGLQTSVGTAAANSAGLAHWELTNVASGKHVYSVYDTTQGIPYQLDGSLAASKLTVTVL